MGIDLLDLFFRIERQFGTRLKQDDLLVLAGGRRPPDLAARDLLRAILASPRCYRCRYDLQGHGAVGRCPECGEPFSPEATWERLRIILAEVGGIDVGEVMPDSLLIRDLGFT